MLISHDLSAQDAFLTDSCEVPMLTVDYSSDVTSLIFNYVLSRALDVVVTAVFSCCQVQYYGTKVLIYMITEWT